MQTVPYSNSPFLAFGAAPAPAVSGYDRYMSVQQTALKFPAMLTAPGPATLAMWLRLPLIPNQAQDFLLDARPAGSAFLFDTPDGINDVLPYADGAALSALNSLYTDTWRKVVLESSQLLQPTLLATNTGGLFLRGDIADVRFYRRAFTAAEKADAAGPFPALGPTDSRWDFRNAATSVPDVSGNGKTLTYAGPGPAPTFTGV